MLRSLIPWRETVRPTFSRFGEEMERMMRPFFSEEFPLNTNGFAPTVNIMETENEFEVTVDLPGIKPEEVQVEMQEGNLWISGERKEEKEENGKTYHRMERRYGQFRRVIALSMPIKKEEVRAEYHEGVLKVILPKCEEVKPKHIEVKVT